MTESSTVVAAAAPQWANEPFVMGTPEQFARLRAWFESVGYTEPALCSAANIPALGQMPSIEGGRKVFTKPDDPQSLLLLLLIEGNHISWETVRSVLPAEGLALLTDLALLQSSVANPSNCVGSVALFPMEDVLVASDRLTGMETIGGEGPPADVVYTPLTHETTRFVQLMPRVPCLDYLEMCAGTGIAALIAAKRFARYAYAADITERSTRFAHFNAALNGLTNFSAVQGDLYEPVAGKQFDVISAHPPYVPSEATELVFRDGGADGEQITRRIVAGLPEFLKPGGLFYLDCMMTDRGADPTEQRLRRMLGPEEDEFDIVVFRSGIIEVKVYQANQLVAGRLSPAALVRQREYFSKTGITQLVGVQVFIQRRAAPRPVVTRHHSIDPAHATADDLLWLVRYASSTVAWEEDDVRRLLDSRPRALPGIEAQVRSALRDGEWVPVSTTVTTSRPFAANTPCPPWFPGLLGRCDGRVTVREHLARLREEGTYPPSKSDDEFAQMIRELADVPLVELEEFPMPRSAIKSGA